MRKTTSTPEEVPPSFRAIAAVGFESCVGELSFFECPVRVSAGPIPTVPRFDSGRFPPCASANRSHQLVLLGDSSSYRAGAELILDAKYTVSADSDESLPARLWAQPLSSTSERARP